MLPDCSRKKVALLRAGSSLLDAHSVYNVFSLCVHFLFDRAGRDTLGEGWMGGADMAHLDSVDRLDTALSKLLASSARYGNLYTTRYFIARQCAIESMPLTAFIAVDCNPELFRARVVRTGVAYAAERPSVPRGRSCPRHRSGPQAQQAQRLSTALKARTHRTPTTRGANVRTRTDI